MDFYIVNIKKMFFLLFLFLLCMILYFVYYYQNIRLRESFNDGQCNPYILPASDSAENANSCFFEFRTRATPVANENNGYQFVPYGNEDRSSYFRWGSSLDWIFRSGRPAGKVVLQDVPGSVLIGTQTLPNASDKFVVKGRSRFQGPVIFEKDVNLSNGSSFTSSGINLQGSGTIGLQSTSDTGNVVIGDGGGVSSRKLTVNGDSQFNGNVSMSTGDVSGELSVQQLNFMNSSNPNPTTIRMVDNGTNLSVNNGLSITSSDGVEQHRLSVDGSSYHKKVCLYTTDVSDAICVDPSTMNRSLLNEGWNIVMNSVQGWSPVYPASFFLPIVSTLRWNAFSVPGYGWRNGLRAYRIGVTGMYQINVYCRWADGSDLAGISIVYGTNPNNLQSVIVNGDATIWAGSDAGNRRVNHYSGLVNLSKEQSIYVTKSPKAPSFRKVLECQFSGFLISI